MNTKCCAFVCLLALVVAEPALAHAPIEGMSNFYSGLLHPLLVPSHALLWAAIGLLVGQQEQKQTKVTFLSLLPAIILGLIVSNFVFFGNIEIFILIWAAIVGFIVASSLKIPTLLCSVIAIVGVFSIGFDSAQESLSGRAKIVSLIGSFVGIFALTVYAFGFSDFCNSKKNWLQILIRILGSWITASSVLVLALSISASKT